MGQDKEGGWMGCGVREKKLGWMEGREGYVCLCMYACVCVCVGLYLASRHLALGRLIAGSLVGAICIGHFRKITWRD